MALPQRELPRPGAPAAAGDGAPDGDAEHEPATYWALRARGGDPTAQAAFVRATQPEVWRFAASLVDPGSADDLTQETYLRAFRALAGFEARSSVRTWLLGIARRACADHLRAVARRRRLLDRLARQPEPSHPDPAPEFGAADLLRRLNGERRSAFVLTQLIGLSYAEAAAVEDVPVGTIRSRVARARDDLIAAVREARDV